ncbi:MAG: DNA polymerase III [Treponemataceae bacterium]|nr:DNA polymerase III [Treponemataceae bacterium]
MFENILGQPAAEQLLRDVQTRSLPSSLLFEGPPASAKGTAALELARILSCNQEEAPWNCTCPACEQHRFLAHPDVLMMGSKDFGVEIRAAAGAFLRLPSQGSRLFFLRSLRKLLARFNPVLWEGEENRLTKLLPLITALEEGIEALQQLPLETEGTPGELASRREKLVTSLVDEGASLESGGISESIPLFQIRHATYWCRLAPLGKQKVLLIEHADRMQEGARNALLKILEEPPEQALLILTTQRKGAILPTILSRLRPYHFIQRPVTVEQQVIRRVFRDEEGATKFEGLSLYLQQFLPCSAEGIRDAARFFLKQVGFYVLERTGGIPALLSQNKGELENNLALLLNRGETDILPPPLSPQRVVASLLDRLCSFSSPSVLSFFFSHLEEELRSLLRHGGLPFSDPLFAERWQACIEEVYRGINLYNQQITLGLEALFVRLADVLYHHPLVAPAVYARGEARIKL